MAGKLSFSIAVNLLTENFKKGANTIKDSFRSIQMQIITFAAALGFAGFSLQGLVTRLIDTARATSRAITALKNVSGSTREFAENLKFINDTSKKYGLEVGALTSNFAKFTASATQANMPMEQQKKVFESLSRASAAFALSADDTNGVFLALSQMMGKGKISSEELRKQLGARLPVAMQAMAKAAGVSMAGLEKLLKQGKLMSSDIIPKFADALNEMIPTVDTDNIETSVNRLSNVFADFAEGAGVQGKFKSLVDALTSLLESATKNMQNIIVGIIATIVFVATSGATKILKGWSVTADQMVSGSKELNAKLTMASASREAAEKALETSRLNHSVAIGKNRIKTAEKVAKQEILFAKAVIAEDKTRIASDQARASATVGTWTRSFNTLKVGAAKFVTAVKSMWNSFAPAIIASAVIALAGYFKNLYDKVTLLEKATEEYNKDVATETTNVDILFNKLRKAKEGTKEYSAVKNEILGKYGEYLKGLSDEIRTLKDVEGAYRAISSAAIQAAKDRAIEKTTQSAVSDYTDVYGRNISRIQKEFTKKYGKVQGAELTDMLQRYIDSGSTEYTEAFQTVIDSFSKTVYTANGTAGQGQSYVSNWINASVDEIQREKKRLDSTIEEITSIFGNKTKGANVVTTDLKTDDVELTDKEKNKLERETEKRAEALRKLNEADEQRQLDKLAFDNNMRQKSIDNMDEGFAKELAVLKLNYDKEEQAILEYKKKVAKAQLDEAKTQYVSAKGNEIGFEAYYAKADLSKIMPDGLKPADVSAQVDEMMKAAKSAFLKGGESISVEMQKVMNEETLRFSSSLDKQLAEINTFYTDRLKLAKGQTQLTKQLEKNRDKDIEAARLQHKERLLQFETDFSEKETEISSRKYFFEADREKALLDQKIRNAKKLEVNLERQHMNTPLDEGVYQDLKLIRHELKLLGVELEQLPAKKLKEILDLSQSIANVIGQISGMEGIGEQFNVLGQLGAGLFSLSTGDIMGSITSGLGAASSIIGLITSKSERRAAIQRELNKLQTEYNISLRQQNYDLISSIDYARAFRDNLEALQWLVEKGFISDVDYSAWEALREQQEKAIENSKIATQQEKALISVSESGLESLYKDYVKGTAGKNSMGKTVIPILKDWKNGLIDTAEAYKRLGAAGWNGMGDIADRINAASDETNKWGEQLVEVQRQMDEMATGTSFDGFLGDAMNALHEWVKSGKSDITDLADFTEDTLTNAIISSFKYQILAESLKPLYENLSDYLINTPVDQLDKGWIDKWKNDFNKELTEKGGAINEAFKDLGIDPTTDKSTSQSSSQGYSTSMDQETGGSILGRVTGMHETDLRIESIGLRMESIMSAISMPVTSIHRQSVTNGDELKKQTEALNDISQVVQKTYFLIEEGLQVTKNIKQDSAKLENIDSNTKGLTKK